MEALKGVRILDMTHVQAGPTCSQLLAWMGADVIKFENPVGDATRGQLRDVPKADSLYFTMLNCNKRSITVNMKSAEGKAVFVKNARYDKLMEAFGGVGVHATTPAELRRAMEAAVRSRKPTLINAVIDETAGTESGRITSLNPQSAKKK